MACFSLCQVTVGIRASIISVGDIDTVGQQFKCDFHLSACWPEPQLQGRSSTEVNSLNYGSYSLEKSLNCTELKGRSLKSP